MARPRLGRAAALALLFSAACMASLAAPAPRASAQGVVDVTIQNYAFSPSSITVVIGVNDTVTWTNMDSVVHTVTAGGGAFDSGDLAPGQSFTQTFTTPGTYAYHCSIHTYMQGTVTVLGSGSGTTSTPGSSGGVPEFTFQGVAVAAIMVALTASYFLVRRAGGDRSPGKSDLR